MADPALVSAPRALELLVFCQNPPCAAPLAVAHVPAGCIDIMCLKCLRVTRFQVTERGMSVSAVAPSTKLTR